MSVVLLKRSRSRSRCYGSVLVPVIRLSGSRSLHQRSSLTSMTDGRHVGYVV